MDRNVAWVNAANGSITEPNAAAFLRGEGALVPWGWMNLRSIRKYIPVATTIMPIAMRTTAMYVLAASPRMNLAKKMIGQ